MTDRDASNATTAQALHEPAGSPSFSLAAPPTAGAAIGCALAIAASAVWLRIRHRRGRAAAGARFGGYTLGDKIGEGAMGAVYKASHDRLDRPAAVKVLPADTADDRALEQFEREVQMTSKLTHPNTIAIYDFGRADDGTFYYAMEYLDGLDLQTVVEREGPLPPARVAFLLAQAAGALDEAHRAGLLHRDVKPANLMVCQRGGLADVVKVIDFGLVEEVSARTEGGPHDGHRITGTPLYLSPESIAASHTMDARSDLYSLGAVGYYLLTGVPPFSGRNVVELCHHHLTSDPVAPSRRVAGQIPARLEQLILSCLAKEPAERPASAAALRDGLEPLAAAWSQVEATRCWRAPASGRTVDVARSDPSTAGRGEPYAMTALAA